MTMCSLSEMRSPRGRKTALIPHVGMGPYSLHGKPESAISFCGFGLGWSGGEVGNYISIFIGKLREVKRVIRGHTAGKGNWSSRLQISSSDSAQLCSTPLGRS